MGTKGMKPIREGAELCARASLRITITDTQMNQPRVVHYCPVCGTDVHAVQVALDYKHPEPITPTVPVAQAPQPAPSFAHTTRNRVSQELRAEMFRLRAEGLSASEIGRRLGVNNKTVAAHIVGQGRGEKPLNHNGRPLLSPEQVEQIHTLHAQGLTDGAIARQLGLARSAVASRIRRAKEQMNRAPAQQEQQAS